MTPFVLVHGSAQNSRCWDRVATHLRARGHDVVTPQLTKRAANWGFDEYAEEIADSISSPDAIVVGHSFAGNLLPLVPSKRACRALVLVAAAIPEPRKSLRDQLMQDPSMLGREWLAAGPRWRDRSQHAQLAEEFLFHDCDEETRAWAIGTVDLLDAAQLVARPLPVDAWPAVRLAYVVASEDRTLSPTWSRRKSREILGVEPIEIRSGHCPQVSQPLAVAEILDAIASGA